jgi:eukaryotic-like serine/threonine-protein kinase
VTAVCETSGATYGATWTPGDTIIFATDSALMAVPAAGGQPHVLAKPGQGEAFRWPEAMPDGRAVLLTVMEGKILRLAALVLRTGEVKRLSQTGGYPRYASAGFVVLTDPSGIISAVPFDAGRLETTGNPVPIADKVIINTDGDVNLGVSRSGGFAYQGTIAFGSRALLVDRQGAAREAGSDTGFYYTPRLSPDGRRVAMFRFTDFGFAAADVWVMDLAQHTRTRLTFDTISAGPVWTPDGRRIAYTRYSKGILGGPTGAIYWVPSDGSGTPESLVVAPGRWVPAAFEPGGRGLIYSGGTLGSKTEIRRLDLAGSRTDQQVLASSFNNYSPTLSPDGRWLAYVSDESGRPEVYVRPYPGPGGRWQVSLDGGQEPVWSPAGGEIFFRSGDRMMAATVRTQPGFEVEGRTPLFTGSYDQASRYRDYDVTRDGRTFVMLQPAQSTALSVFVTLNWFDQFRRPK